MSEPLPVGASAEMDATPEEVWTLLADPRRMQEFSPELRKVFMLGRRRGEGARFVGINRRKAVVWPTNSKIVRYEPARAIAWHVLEVNATWSYELESTAAGTRVTGRRELPGYTIASRLMTPILGGAHGHDRELAAGVRQTLERMKAVVEQ